MERPLAALAAHGAPLEVRLRIARDLARAVAALHRRGAVHGALSPASVVVAGDGEAVALGPAGAVDPLALAGWAAPEVVRGRRPSRAADAFAAGALAQLALTGRGPFEGGTADPLERARRVLFEAPRPVRLDEPGIPAEVEEVIGRLLERSARRRGTAEELAGVIEAIGRRGGEDATAATATSTSTATSTPTSTSTLTATPTATPTPTPNAAATAPRVPRRPVVAPALAAASGRVAAALRRIPPSPLHRAALAALPLLAVTFALLPRSDAALAREVGRHLARGDVTAAREVLDAAPRGADRAVVEKLRGDVACARHAPDECLRRYRTALAGRPTLRGDEVLRRNVRALLARGESCGTQRSAALLAGQLRDPDALAALQAARRSAGFFGFLCTGDAFDRAIAATRAGAR